MRRAWTWSSRFATRLQARRVRCGQGCPQQRIGARRTRRRTGKDPEQSKRVIRDVTQLMHRRISLLVSLPVAKLDRMSLQSEARAIAANASPQVV